MADDNRITLQAVLDDDQVQAEIDRLNAKLRVLQENVETFSSRRGEWSIQRQIANLTSSVEILRRQLTGAAVDLDKLSLAQKINQQFGLDRVIPVGSRTGGFQTASTVSQRAFEDSAARDERVNAEMARRLEAARLRALSQVQRVVEPTLPLMVEPTTPRMVGFEPTAAEKQEQALKRLTSQALQAQEVLHHALEIKADPAIIQALERNVDNLKQKFEQLGLAMPKLPPRPPTEAERTYDLQREIDKYSQISNLRDQEFRNAQRSAEQRMAQAEKDHQFDLQRRIDVAGQIDNEKKLRQAREEAEAEKAARTGYKEADKEIRDQEAIARQNRAYDQERKNDIAQQVAAWRALTDEQRKAAQTSGQLSSGFTRGSRAATIFTNEVRHAVSIVDSLSAGRTGQVFASIGAAIRDAGLSVQTLVFGLGGLVALQIGRRIISDLAEWNAKLSELALKQQGFAAAAGMSGQQFAVFTDSMRLAGGNAETAARAVEILHRRIEQAVETPAGPIMDAFRQIGLSWEELRARLSDPAGSVKTLHDLADAYRRMGDVPQRTAIFQQLLGTRQFTELIRYIRYGEEGIKNFARTAEELNSPFQDNVDRFAKMGERIEELDLAWEGFKASVVGSNLFGGAIEVLTTLLAMLSGATDEAAKKAVPISDAVAARIKQQDLQKGVFDPNTGMYIGGGQLNLPPTVATAPIPPAPPGSEAATRPHVAGGVEMAPTGPALPVDYSEAALERAYMARLAQQRVTAQLIHDQATLNQLAQDEARYTAMNADERQKFLQTQFPGVGKAQADQITQQAKAGEIIARQQRDQAQFAQETQIAQLKLDEAIAESRGEIEKVVELRKQEAQLVSQSAYATPQQKIAALTQVMREATQEQARAFQETENLVRSQERLDALRINGQRALLQAQVAQHTMSRSAAAEAESRLTSQVMAGEEARTAAMLQADGLTRQQKEQLYEHLSELYQKDADAQLKAQEAVSKAIEQENDRRARVFEETFSRIGSSFEESVAGVLSGKETVPKALANLRTSIIESFAKGAMDLGSQLIGKQLAGALGVNTEGLKDTSISTVLGKAVSGLFGLQQKTPEDHLKAAAQKQQQAAEAQQRAVQLQESAARTMNGSGSLLESAGKALLEAAKLLKESAEGERKRAGVPSTSSAKQTPANFGAAGEYGVGQRPQTGDHVRDALNYFQSKGLTAAQSAGIVGVLQQESGAGLNPNDVNSSSGAYGIAQWLGSRKPAALTTGGDFQQQLDLIWKEFQTTEIAAFKKIQAAQTPEQAALGMREFERGGDYGGRDIIAANALYAKAGATGSPVPVTVVNDNQPRTYHDMAVGQSGRSVLPPGTKYNSKGEPYVDTPAESQAAVAQSMAAIQTRGFNLNPQEIQQSVQSGVQNGMQMSQTYQQAAIQQGTNQLNQAQNAAQQAVSQNNTATTDNTAALRSVTTSLQSNQGSASSSTTDTKNQQTTSGLFSSFGSLTQAAALASSAMNLFGVHTSRTMQMITGGLGLLSGIGNLFGSGGSGSSGSSGGLFGSTGSFFSGLGGIFSLFKGIFSFFDLGGVIPSAANGMMLANSGANIDGRGGRLIVAHPGEAVIPSHITSAMFRSGILQSAANGTIVDGFSAVARSSGPTMMENFQNFSERLSNDNDIRGGEGGREGDLNIHLNSIDSRSGIEFIMRHQDHIARAVSRARRNFKNGGW